MHFVGLLSVLALISSVSASDLHTRIRLKRIVDFCSATKTDCLNGAQINYSCCIAYMYNSGAPVTSSCNTQYTTNKNNCQAADTAAQYNGNTGCQTSDCCDGVFATQTGFSKAAGAANAKTCTQATPTQMQMYMSAFS